MKHRTHSARNASHYPHVTPLNWVIAASMAIALGAGSIFDGPSELEAMQATAASVQDAAAQDKAQSKMIAAQAHKQVSRAKKQAQELAQQTQTASAQ